MRGERLVLPTEGAVVVEAPVDAVVAAPGKEAWFTEEVGGRTSLPTAQFQEAQARGMEREVGPCATPSTAPRATTCF